MDPQPTASFRPALGVAACMVAVAMAYAALFGAGMRPGHRDFFSDSLAFEIPKYQLAADHLGIGGPLTWNPWEFGGIPMLATSHTGAAYPVVWLSYSIFRFDSAHDAFLALHLLIGALGALWFARDLGCRLPTALLASLWVASPLILGRGYSAPGHLSGAMWIPLLLLLARRLTLRRRLREAGLFAMTATMVVTSGYPPYTLISLYAIALGLPFWLMERGARESPGDAKRLVAVWAIAATMAALLSAVQLLPFGELLQASVRDVTANDSIDQIMNIADKRSWLIYILGIPPLTFGDAIRNLWQGIGPGLLLPIACGIALHRWSAPAWHILALAVLGTLAPFGLIKALPLYEFVRFAVEWCWMGLFAVYFVSALGIESLCKRFALRAPLQLAIVAASLATTLVWSSLATKAITLWDGVPYAPVETQWLDRAGCVVADGGGRVLWPAATRQGALLRAHIPSIIGYEQSIQLERVDRLQRALGLHTAATMPGTPQAFVRHRSVVDRLGLRCIVSEKKVQRLIDSGFRPWHEGPANLWIYVNEQALPRARFVPEAVFARDADAALELLLSDSLDATRTAVLERAPTPRPACEPGLAPVATIEHDSPDEVRIRLRTDCPGHLVLADTWTESWQATVDGAPTAIDVADFVHRAVEVEAGEHAIVFRHRSAAFRIGRAASGLGLIAFIAAVSWPRRLDPLAGPRRREPADQPAH